ncbi:MFS transporter [Nocardia sp. NEAU-G5]|uniref:MFS transporter n=1 Tax=Nocardia albiluteola TaxID=2842303 RepID=A0ABS6B361_9NOCA|nr:MFS transporter [Nocardia albiluteola]MBU3064553.1 MFS transporter [Nocardia albiluteola]
MPQRITGTTRTIALTVVLLAAFMDLMDVTILNVMLPTIEADLHAGPAALEWMLSGYTLALTAGLIAGARLGDRWGHKRVFIIGIAGFTAASALCSVSIDPGMLIAARVGQGLFAAAMIPQVLSQIQLLYRAEERGPAMAAFSALSGIAATLGPILGPVLLDWNLAGQGWRLVFWVNVPVGVFAAIAAARLLPDGYRDNDQQLDPMSVLLAGSGLALVIYPLITASAGTGWPSWAYLVIAAGLAALALLYVRQRRIAARGGRPLIDLTVLAQRCLAGGLAVQLLFLVPIMGFFLTVMQFLQRGLAMSPLHAGSTMLAWSITVTVFAGLAATVLLPRIGRRTVQLGLVITAIGLALLATVAAHAHSHTGTLDLLPGILVGAAGMGLVVAPIAQLTLADLAPDRIGTGSGLFNTVSQLGACIGVAAIGTLFFGGLHHNIGTDRPAAYGHAFEQTLWVSVGLLAAAFAISYALPRPEAAAHRHPAPAAAH